MEEEKNDSVKWEHNMLMTSQTGIYSSTFGGADSLKATNLISCNKQFGVRDVWKYNLYEEFHMFRKFVQAFAYVAMDTEFPGIVARPIGEFRNTEDYQYQLLRCNVNLLQVIQLGFIFLDRNGTPPTGFTTWQFNFKFDLSEHMYAEETVSKLQESGTLFRKHEEDGIDPLEFAALLMSSGVVLTDNIKWISFHNGHDFGYLVKLLTATDLPEKESDFFELLGIYFPVIYEVKDSITYKSLKDGYPLVVDNLELQMKEKHQE